MGDFLSSSLRWMDDAACRGLDTEMFFGYFDSYATSGRGVTRAERDKLQKARGICHTCPVKFECATHALRHPEPYGIWGGLTRKERNAVRRNRNRRAA